MLWCSDELTLYLQEVQKSSGTVTETIPEDVLAYVEDGLNPDKYTRRFVNMLMKDNQFVNGKIDAVQVWGPEV
jgi:mediator of RNA polymerase II transcription subunit 10